MDMAVRVVQRSGAAVRLATAFTARAGGDAGRRRPAVAGAVMQALFENPLAEPGLLGVANGAGVALVLTVLLGHGLLPVALMSAAAIAGALAMTFCCWASLGVGA